jgi:hypothetical protein
MSFWLIIGAVVLSSVFVAWATLTVRQIAPRRGDPRDV